MRRVLRESLLESKDADARDSFCLVSEFSEWEDMPSLFAKWLQSQDGLKINGVPMSSRNDVETAFYLLHCQDKSPLSRDPGNLSIVEAATLVANAYIREITSSQSQIVKEGTIPGKPGQVIYRKCSMCKMSALDDSFPIFCASMQERYVMKVVRQKGCGRPGCQGNPSLPPTDPRQAHTRAEKRSFEQCSSGPDRNAAVSTLCRFGKDLEGCAPTVIVQCTNCKFQREDIHPRWTSHNPTRYLESRLKCNGCGKKDSYWRPADKATPSVGESSLRSTVNGFKDVGCNLAEFPRFPEIIFAKASFEKRSEMLKEAAKHEHGNSRATKKIKRHL
jgi:hypothetical protein